MTRGETGGARHRLIRVALVAAVGLGARSTAASGPGHRLGSPDAPVEVIEFTDYGCPACGRFARGAFLAIEAEFVATGRVRWVVVPFVLGNFANSAAANRAAECAAMQDRFRAMHGLLFARQAAWSGVVDPGPAFLRMAADAGLDGERFEACYRGDEGVDRMLRNERFAADRRIRATPTFVIGGRYVEGAPSVEVFRTLLDTLAPGE